MNRSVASLKLEGAVLSATGGATCGSCGETFETPLLAMVFSESEVQEYYACPNCLSKVANIHEKPAEPEEAAFDVAETEDFAEVEEAEEAVDSVDVDSDVDLVDEAESVEDAVEEEVAEPVSAEVEGGVEGPTGCTHHLGYLKKRGNTPIPEECLTCSKMIDCMY